MNQAGTAFVEIEPELRGFGSKLSRGIDPHVDRSAKNVESKFGGAFRSVGAMVGGLFAGAAVVSFGRDMLTLGTQVDTFGRKAKTVFEGNTDDVTRWAKNNASAFGITDDSLRGLAANFGDLLKPMGFTSAQAADMSTKVVGLSGALSAWSGGQRTAAEVSNILAKAMLGERESLKELGISITEADVQGRLLAKGQKDLTGAALEQAKALATQELIFEKSADAQKAWGDGSMDAVKKQNALKEKIGELKEDLANKLRPAFASAIGYLVDTAIPGIEKFGGRLGPLRMQVGEFFTTLRTGLPEGEVSPLERFGLKVRDVFNEVKTSLTGVNWESVKAGIASIEWDRIGGGVSLFGAALKLVADHSDTLIRFLPLLAAGFVAVQLAQAANNTVGRDSIIGFTIQIASTLTLAASNRTLATSIAGTTVTMGTATAATTGLTAAQTTATASTALLLGKFALLAGGIVAASRVGDEHVPVLRRIDEGFINLESRIPIVGGFLADLDRKVLGFGNSAEEAGGKTGRLRDQLDRVSGDWLASIKLDTSDAEYKLAALQRKMDALGVQASALSLKADSGDIAGPVSRAPSAKSNDGIPGRFQRERGGPVTKGVPYLVGEKRAELFVPDTSGYVLPRVPAKFHNGGIVQGGPRADVPIVARAGEGVFTEAQMAAMSGGGMDDATIRKLAAALAAAVAANPIRASVGTYEVSKAQYRAGKR